jgi:predicted P-loop ATPase
MAPASGMAAGHQCRSEYQTGALMATTDRQTIIATIRDALAVLCEPGQVVELRIPKVDNKKRTDSGYFTDYGKLATAAARFEGRASGVYITLNPVEPALLARAENRVKEWAELTTSDDYIARRRWLPIDCDPTVNGKKRPAGISSTDAEHAAAIHKAYAVADYLASAGWPAPIVADTGNGGALLYRVDLPNDKDSAALVENCLKALAKKFNDAAADIDTAVFNAARIWKLYGTLAGKGDSTADRPHRRALLISVPEVCQPVALADLKTIARQIEPVATSTNGTGPKNGAWPIHAKDWLKRHGIGVATEKPGKDGSTIYVLDECPFNSDHAAPDACVIQHKSGALVFKCLHNGCASNDWRALRLKFEPTAYDWKDGGADDKPQNNGEEATKPDTPTGPSYKHSEMIAAALAQRGYTFQLNLCSDLIEVNGEPITDVMAARIRTIARDTGLKPLAAVEDTYMVEAANHAYHPIKDYLDGLVWDGQPHIARCAAALHGTDPPVRYPDGAAQHLAAVYLRRWLIGVIAKTFDQHQNMMLVLVGPQRMGKSSWAQWLCPLRGYFLRGPINVTDKDSDVRLIGYWIWEVSELDATTRRSDVSALKDFITRDIVTVRKAYGRHDMRKPALASLIGTVNESAGFLIDDTGNRRFFVARIEKIDWAIINQLDRDQIWAEAVAAYRKGETWELQGAEYEAQTAQNRTHEVASILEDWIVDYFLIGGLANGNRMTAGEIISYLRSQYDIRLHGSERSQAMELARVMKLLGIPQTRTNSWRGYEGILPKTWNT